MILDFPGFIKITDCEYCGSLMPDFAVTEHVRTECDAYWTQFQAEDQAYWAWEAKQEAEDQPCPFYKES